MTSVLRILLEASTRIIVVAVAVQAAIWLFRIRSSVLRHKAWRGVLFAMLAMPVLPSLSPHIEIWRVAPPPPIARVETQPSPNTGLPASAERLPGLPMETRADADHAPSPLGGWPALLTGVYALVAFALLARLFAGWTLARGLLAGSRPVIAEGIEAWECANISTPITVGLRAPKILLPPDWSGWPKAKITAVTAHEVAHVNRRDPLTGFLAHINRSIFWFHPLAWYLARQIMLNAEHACDDAGVLSLGDVPLYSRVLLDIADTARRRGGTLQLHGAGAAGAGLLAPRIERLARGLVAVHATKAQQVCLAVSCGAAIFLAAACSRRSLPELKADPDYARQITESIARSSRFQEIDRMTAADAESLEAEVRRNPEDAAAREKLMTFYQSKGRHVLGDDRASKGFWAMQVWCIEHHPEDSCSYVVAPLFDPASYEKGAKAWAAILRRGDVTPEMQVAAVNYFERADPERAEKIVTSASIDEQKRRRLLSGIYVGALAAPSANNRYTEDLRSRLDRSTDAQLLAAVGFALARSASRDRSAGVLGRKYLDRAATLDPGSVDSGEVERTNRIEAAAQRYRDTRTMVGAEVSQTQYQRAKALPADRRAWLLPLLAEQAYFTGASLDYYRHDAVGARKDWDLARRYANEALAVENGFRNDPDYPDRVYKANIISALVAMRADGNSKAARGYLKAAGPLKENGNWFPVTLKLLTLMLRYGSADDRAAVIEFCEIHGKVARTPGIDLPQSARKLREGVMPTWYQFEAAQFKR